MSEPGRLRKGGERQELLLAGREHVGRIDGADG
jgi:hypothetical protein